jgi:hypothetical protein
MCNQNGRFYSSNEIVFDMPNFSIKDSTSTINPKSQVLFHDCEITEIKKEVCTH